MDVAEAFRLTDEVAIVTGGGSGIGESTATVLAGAGARVVVADLDLDSAERVAETITNVGCEAVARRVDVSDREDVDALVAATMADHGRLDVLVNNAGIMIRRPLLEVSAEEFEHVLSVNLKSVLYGVQAAARVMGPGSAVVNMLSTIIDHGTAGTGSYAATKKAAEALTRTFAIELGPLGIRVNGVAPGWTESGMTRQKLRDESGAFDAAGFGALAERMSARSPLAGVTEARDSAYAVLYLVSAASRFVTGHVVRVNGGASMV